LLGSAAWALGLVVGLAGARALRMWKAWVTDAETRVGVAVDAALASRR